MFFDFLLGFVYPDRCVVCGRMDVVLCKSCFGKLRLSLRKDKDLDAVWEYKDKRVKKIIERIKFDFDKCEIWLGIIYRLRVYLRR